MGRLWTLMAILVSVTIFLYVRQMIHHLQERQTKKQKNIHSGNNNMERICPVCHTHLKSDEYLYASIYKGQPEDKIFIKGCKYCYRTPKKGDRKL